MTKDEIEEARHRAHEYLKRASIVLAEEEAAAIETAYFCLDELDQTGLQLVTYVNTERVCAKELVLFPRQTCSEHKHPPVGGEPGKEETFRCRSGDVFLYVEGSPIDPEEARVRPPEHRADTYTAWNEIVLKPGE